VEVVAVAAEAATAPAVVVAPVAAEAATAPVAAVVVETQAAGILAKIHP